MAAPPPAAPPAAARDAGLLGRVPIYSVDPAGGRAPHPGIRVLAEKAEELLPAVCERLGC